MEESSEEKSPVEELSFEEAYRQIEKIIQTLESGRGGLEESLDEYEKATRLVLLCRKKLAAASQRIETLKGLDADGEPILEKINPESLQSNTDVAGRHTRSGSKKTVKAPNVSSPNRDIPPQDFDDQPPF